MSDPGRILILTLQYPSAIAAMTLWMSAFGVGWMPNEIPVAILSRVPPIRFAKLTPSCTAARAHTPISTAALAILCPRKSLSSSGATSSGCANA